MKPSCKRYIEHQWGIMFLGMSETLGLAGGH